MNSEIKFKYARTAQQKASLKLLHLKGMIMTRDQRTAISFDEDEEKEEDLLKPGKMAQG